MKTATSIAQLLETEINASAEFSKRNFGLKYGDGFRELAAELLASESFAMHATIHSALSSLSGKEFQKALARLTPQHGAKALTMALQEEPDIVEGSLAFFYWGLAVGRKLTAQETAALERMEG